MVLKIIILLLLAAIVVSLFSGLFFLVKDSGRTRRTVNALTFRITLSVILIILVAYGFYSGEFVWNQPWVGVASG